MSKPLWSPSEDRIKSSKMHAFKAEAERVSGQQFDDYQALWQWSVDDQEMFWDLVWDFCGVIGEKGDHVLDNNGGQMMGSKFFPDARLNYAENLLKRRDDANAMIFRDEAGTETKMTRAQLYDAVSRWQQALRAEGVGEGDRVAGYLPNMKETIVASLAAISLGAVWSSASPDFGVQGVVDRFGQIEPTVLVTVDGYYYNGKTIDVLAKVKDIKPQLEGLKRTVVIPFAGSKTTLDDGVSKDEFLKAYSPKEIDFTQVNFNDPLFIMFSSGTTGAPKCIVHGHGGTLIQHLKEHQLQCDIKQDDNVFYFTTCGWMMWNWMITALASDATLLLYDGSPFYPDGNVLWDYTSKHDCTLFGTSAKYIEAMKLNNIHPKNTHDLRPLKMIASTGSPLSHEGFDFTYENIKKDVHLTPVYGGTDIVAASFGIGNPISPVYRGEMQGPALATSIEIYDEDGAPIPAGSGSGEVVLTKPIPSMPIYFWNDEGDARYRAAYFEEYDNVWRHGDWAEYTNNKGLIVHGRSDATLNPGGVRIGTAEIYRQVEKVEGIQNAVVIGQDWEDDVRVVLFVVLQGDMDLDDGLIKTLKGEIRQGASPRHVPAKIIAVDDIPRTISGKISEIAVRDVVMNRPIKNKEALANPEALDLFKDIEELQPDYGRDMGYGSIEL